MLSDEEWVEQKLFPYLKHTGPSLSPFNAWVLLKALETLEVRVTRQAESAAKLAEVLAEHPAVERIYYPGHASHPQRALAQAADVVRRHHDRLRREGRQGRRLRRAARSSGR